MTDPQIPKQDQKSKAKKEALEPGQVPGQQPAEEPSRWTQALKEIAGGNAVISLLAIFVALIVGALFIAIFNEDVQSKAAYFFSRPLDTLGEAWHVIVEAYSALFSGGVFGREGNLIERLAPFSEALFNATSLIAAGLAVALAFRVGLFNIGARGQIIVAVIFSGFLSFHLPTPTGFRWRINQKAVVTK